MTRLLSAQSVGTFLEKACDVAPDTAGPRNAPAFEAIGRRWTELGLCPGDVIILSLPNGLPLLEHFFGALLGGFVPVLIAPNTPSPRLRELIHVLRARAVAAPRLNPTALEVQKHVVAQIEAVLIEPALPSLTRPGEVVVLTSGTSGFFSGCVFGIEQLLLNAERHAQSIGQTPEDTVLVNLPLYFSYALVAQTLATLLRGGRLVVDGPPFHAARYARTVAQYDISISSITPLLARSLSQNENLLAESPRVLTVGGDALSSQHVAGLIAGRPGKELYLTYGLTQAGPRVSTLAAHAEPPARYGSVGLPLAGTKVSLQQVGGDAGLQQLHVSSATVMRRRIGLVEGWSPQDFSSERTIATGDIFEQDADGYLYFHGRLSDFVIRKGEKISLAGVRRIAARLPHVVHARTRVIRSDEGEEDFELTLYLSETNLSECGPDCTHALRRQLRRTEMPCRIHVEQSERVLSQELK
jgi:acyl-CoA synthetase (AMP-forming)/AMP-acid ligase II